ncbi:MAG: helix-turn-helix domain-containing protein [Akkermansiaceae bacterium]|nr:helix-turn-helix domain-containing protein [Akkermansiaceae bacterium]MCP5545519.1 helix-turn-helix domain-containing protein [Akkermansiaceae bacterium]MCP5545774.1 helix-turn-helix domain-containing protein [Akkermansiaceae bacterium]
MTAKEQIPDFNFDDLVTSMQKGMGLTACKITARTHRLKTRAASIPAKEIAAIRAKLNVSQAVFADLLNVPKATAVAWERGLRLPSGAAVRLLQIAKDSPGALVDVAAKR